MSFVYHKIFTQIDQTVDTIPPALSSTFLAIITKKYQLVFKAPHQRGVVHRAGDAPLFSQSKAKYWWYLSELISDQHAHAHWIEGVNMWAALNLEWQLGGWGPLQLELTAQRCATGTSPVCFCYLLSAGATLGSTPAPRPVVLLEMPELQTSAW